MPVCAFGTVSSAVAAHPHTPLWPYVTRVVLRTVRVLTCEAGVDRCCVYVLVWLCRSKYGVRVLAFGSKIYELLALFSGSCFLKLNLSIGICGSSRAKEYKCADAQKCALHSIYERSKELAACRTQFTYHLEVG